MLRDTESAVNPVYRGSMAMAEAVERVAVMQERTRSMLRNLEIRFFMSDDLLLF